MNLILVPKGLKEKGEEEQAIKLFFGILQRGGKVYTEIVPDCAKAKLQEIIRGRVDLENIIHSDGWRGYNGLVDLGYKEHYRAHHSTVKMNLLQVVAILIELYPFGLLQKID